VSLVHALQFERCRLADLVCSIIRIILMVPIYAVARFLSFWFYWHAIYYQVISDCWEAFAIASFFALLCHYTSDNLHDQKDYFRALQPIQPWIWPVSWMRKCCGGERGIWRTPRSGLTWFNIIWFGIYQYCFIRVSMTVTAVLTQYFERYCESSNMPWFSHIWVRSYLDNSDMRANELQILVIEASAVTVAMYMVIQFYIQLRHDLASHSPLLKVAAIKLVIFLSFWQSFLISVLTSSRLNVIKETDVISYPDITIGIPSLLICVEMAFFAVLHLFAYPHSPYKPGHKIEYPGSDSVPQELGPKKGGPLGILAIVDALNPWDIVKAFGRGIRWIFVGRRHRENDISYKMSRQPSLSLDPINRNNTNFDISYGGARRGVGSPKLPIAEEFRRSKFGLPSHEEAEEGAGLISNAQPNPVEFGTPRSSPYKPARDRYDPVTGQEISTGGRAYDDYKTADETHIHPVFRQGGPAIGIASSAEDEWNPVQEVPGRVPVQRPLIVGNGPPTDEMGREEAHRFMWGGREPIQSHHGEVLDRT
jgi:hypothetical protein